MSSRGRLASKMTSTKDKLKLEAHHGNYISYVWKHFGFEVVTSETGSKTTEQVCKTCRRCQVKYIGGRVVSVLFSRYLPRYYLFYEHSNYLL